MKKLNVQSGSIRRCFRLARSTTLATRINILEGKSTHGTFAKNMDDHERNHIKTFDCYGDQNLFADGKGLILNEENANNRQRRHALLLPFSGNGCSRYLRHPPKHRRREGLLESGGRAERILEVHSKG